MPEDINRPYLGRGWSFPPSFQKNSRKTGMVSGEEDIRESLTILLSTPPGSRVMRPDFGCDLSIMLFEPLTTSLITRVKENIRTSILFFEPRIDLNRVELNTQNIYEGVVQIEVDYTIRSTNSRFNFVYPFYLQEGINIQANL